MSEQQRERGGSAASMRQGGLMFAAGVTLAAASFVVELAIVRFFKK